MSADRGHLDTEGRHPDSGALDELTTADALALFTQADREAVAAVAAAREGLAAAVELVAARLAAGGRLFYVGAGTSGRLGVLDASECPPTFQSDPSQVQGVIAGGVPALTDAVEGAEDDHGAGARAMRERNVAAGDAVLGISAGGTTPFVHGALEQAGRVGAARLFMACVPAAQVAVEVEVDLRLLTGPELLAGSTRLKAGTATKLALNALSTLVMARLGKVHGNLMVDVNTSANVKLVDRGERILMALTGVGREAAAALLARAGGRVKLAAVLAARGVEVDEAERLLAENRGVLRGLL
ncbi:MAG: N-acetylmuramic acid 6-phosphate etherase [Planctomycetota bacterium]|nr:N-acetylmuramic acid 6-phosphate etherase [Planctomycetota bacterium]